MLDIGVRVFNVYCCIKHHKVVFGHKDVINIGEYECLYIGKKNEYNIKIKTIDEYDVYVQYSEKSFKKYYSVRVLRQKKIKKINKSK